MGVVHEGFDPVIERRVAIKTLRLELFEPSQIADVRSRFKREAQAAGQLAHPHIVTVHDYGEVEGTPFIVMEFLAGNELSKILSRGARLPLSEVVRLVTQLLGALAYAHEHKVVHRDIKPGNIFVLDDGSLKVVDFGIAHVEASNLTDTGALLGTPAYMSPEQFLALPIDERSDIFSTGVILYELLTGDKPFTGSVTTVMQKVLHHEPIEPSLLNPMLSAAWNTVVKRAIAKKPEARFQSARQFSETIKQVFEKSALDVSVEATLVGDKAADQGGDTLRLSPEKHQVSKAQRPVPPASAGPETGPVGQSSRKGLAIAGIAVAVVAGAAAFYASQRPRDDAARQEPASKTAQKDDGASKRAAAENAVADAKAAAEKLVQETKPAQKKAATEKVAKAAERQVKEKAPSEVARLEKLRAERVEADRLAAERATEERLAAERATAERLAVEKATARRLVAENATVERLAAERATVERLAAEKAAAAERLAAEKATAERLAAEKAAAQRLAAEKSPNILSNLMRAFGRTEKANQPGESRLPPCPGSFNASTWTNCIGTFAFTTGDKYVGEYRDGRYHGQGAYTFANGNKHVGEYRDGMRNGQGTYTFSNGDKYVGEYRDGRYHGQGTFSYANGSRHVGEYRDGRYHGQGTFYRSDGSVLQSGFWENGKFVGSGRW